MLKYFDKFGAEINSGDSIKFVWGKEFEEHNKIERTIKVIEDNGYLYDEETNECINRDATKSNYVLVK